MIKTTHSVVSRIRDRKRAAQKGLTLIESLVALLVLALGVLGLAGVQSRVLVETRTTNSRAVAVRLAEDLSERMQFNTEVRLARPALNPNPYAVAWGALPAVVDCVGNTCTAAQLAQLDVNQWKTSLASLLPGGDATVFQSPTDPRQFGVMIGWNNNLSTRANADVNVFSAPFQVVSGVAGAVCPNGLICHLVFILP